MIEKICFQNIVDEIEDLGVVLLDADGHIISWNKGAEKIRGYKQNEIVGVNFSIFYPKDALGLPVADRLIDEAKINGKTTYRGWNTKKDGTAFWCEVIVKSLYDNEGKLTGFSKVIKDLTEQKEIQQQIEFDRSNLDALINNNTSDLLWSIDRNYKLISSNRRFDEMVKMMSGKIISKGMDIFDTGFPEERVIKFKNFYDRAFSGETFKEIEYSSLPADYWTEISYYPIRKGEEIIGTACCAHDITERVRTEAEIRNSEHRFRALIEQSTDAIAILSASGKPLYVSPSIKNILGYTDEEVIQLDPLFLIHPDDRSMAVLLLEHVLANPGISTKSQPIRKRHKDGGWRWVEATVTNRLHEPAINGIVDNFRDITEQKIASEQLVHSNRLYSFISSINQAIVHAKDEQALFDRACNIATEIGKFDFAWIGNIDVANSKIKLSAHSKASAEDLELFSGLIFEKNGPTASILESGGHFVTNNFADIPDGKWKRYALSKGFKSAITLPIRKSGELSYSFTLFSTKPDFFSAEEINLLEEAAGDISFALDVFEKEKLRASAENKLKHSEQRLKQAQGIAHFGSWELDFDTGKALWADEALKIYGLAPDENEQTYGSWMSFIHPDDIGHVLEVIKESEANHSRSAYHHRIVRRDGSVRHIYSMAQYQFDNEGRPTGLYGVAHDVTEMKESEDALKQSKANLRLIVDMIPQSIFVKDSNGKFVFVNKSFAELYGRTPKEIVSKTIRDTIPDKNDASEFTQMDQRVIDTGKTQIIPELKFIDYQGKERIFHTVKVPYSLSGMNEKAVLGVATDITDQKKHESERIRIVADIVQRNKDLEQFSYIVSHNLRAPVANITGLADILLMLENDKDQEKIMMDELSAQVKKLDGVIKDLNYTLQVKHQVNENREIIKFSELIDDIKMSIDNLLRSEHVQVICDFSAVDEILTLKSYMYSIFFNLISNSIKYRQPEIKPVIEISGRIENNKIQLVFKDNGLGIDLAKRGGQVFGLYKRFHEHAEGKGMGLYMVKTQVETLGGKIAIASEVNKGTTFTIVFDYVH
jgi:PAS domain S-box-containing protein